MSSITQGQLAEIQQGLLGLDGVNTKDGYVNFRFPTETLWAIVANQDKVTSALKLFNAARRALARQHGLSEGDQITKENKEKAQAFFEALEVLADKPAEIELLKIRKETLDLGKNQILPSTLAKLMPILE